MGRFETEMLSMIMANSSLDTTRDAILSAFDLQVGWCSSLGSPFTAEVLSLLRDDLAHDGRTAELLRSWPGDPLADALPLRFAGALHALVLSGAAPDLAACYPPLHSDSRQRLWSALNEVLARQDEMIRRFLTSPPQTNEVGRSGVLLGGFLTVAALTGLPLRLLEIGASAGLNLVFDKYRYRLGSASWGDPGSPVVLSPNWKGGQPPLSAPLRVAERAACDRAPVDLADAAQRLRLRSYIWPDQTERLQRLEAAMTLARREGLAVEQADAAIWVPEQLATAAEGLATVLFHSIMWTYVPASDQASIAAAGRRATEAAPLAWLRFEPSGLASGPELSLTTWPGEQHRRLAVATAHGNDVTWL